MKRELKHSYPSEEGVKSEYIINFLNECEKADSEIHGIMIARHGNVIFEAYNAPYSADIPHIMHSFTKILTNTAVGLAYDAGLLKLDDKILKFFPEYKDSANEFLKECTVRHLITMRNGQERSIGGNEWRPLKSSWKEAYFKVPFDKKPGETFMYSSGNSYILSYIIQKLEGKTCKELIDELIGKEIGLNDFDWMLSPEGVCSGGNGVSLTVENMLRIGLLYLNKGKWNGKQLISEEWVNFALGYLDSVEPDNSKRYNFHWEQEGDIWSAKGLFGQICGIIPDQDMAFAITSADEEYKAVNLFQKEVLDKIKSETKTDKFDISKDEILKQKGLRMTLEGKNVSVKEHEKFKDLIFEPEENKDGITKVELHMIDENKLLFIMSDARGRHEVLAGIDHWIHGTTTVTGAYLHHQYEQDESKISAIAYWTEKNQLMMEWRFPEMAFWDHVSLTWEGNLVKMDRWVNMNSQDVRRPTLYLKG